MPMKNPCHPGDFIRTEIIAPAGLSVTAAAKALRVSRPALSSLLNGKAALSGDMALRIETAFGVNMDTPIKMRSAYYIAQTRKHEKDTHIRSIPKITDGNSPVNTWSRLFLTARRCMITSFILPRVGNQPTPTAPQSSIARIGTEKRRYDQ
jgi:addiction module HigA family antidote